MPVAETVAIVASIIAIVQISDRVISSCKFYLEAASDTPSELRAILVEISTLKSVLESLQFLETCAHAAPALWKQLSGQDGPIEECRRSITDMEKLFPADNFAVAGSASGPKRRKVQLVRTSLAWPLKARRARGLLQVIIQQKTMINLALTTDSSQEIKLIKNDTKEIRHMLTESQRREISQWLEKTDPSSIHNRAWKLHEKETSSWMLRSPEWDKWLAGDVPCLWIHGIPGAGKTILTSFLVEQLKKHCKHRERSGQSYYYCFFGHNQDEAAPFLQWTIAQLCRQSRSVPNLVYELYARGGQPSLPELLLALEDSLQGFDTAHLILDAADESKPREDLLRVLRDLATDARFSKIRLLVTSREYIDIEQKLEPISRSISMSNALVEDDIRKHVHSILHSKPKFQRWPADLQVEVEEAVVKGSKGMFRWAVCQLDHLQRLKCDGQIIRNALATLPKTLDETYERIFNDIPKDERPFARHALQWICFHQDMYKHYHPMSLQVLMAATEISVCKKVPQESDFEYDAERLRNMLGCLITVDEQGLVFLAHYTVKEYLESQRISESATSYFGTGQEATIKDCMRTILQGAQAINLSEKQRELLRDNDYNHTPDAFIQNFAVYCVASSLMLLLTRQNVVASDALLLQRAVDLSNPSLDHYDDFAYICNSFENGTSFFYEQNLGLDWSFPSWRSQPDCTEASILLHLLLPTSYSDSNVLVDAFLKGKEASRIVQSNISFSMDTYSDEFWLEDGIYAFDGSLLEVMAQLSPMFSECFVWLLDQCDTAIGHGVLLAVVAFHDCFDEEEGHCVIEKILSGQADPNASGYLVTALQIAVATYDIEGVQELLQAGAEANATGDENGVAFKTDSVLEVFNQLHGLSPLHICRKFDGLVRGLAYHQDQMSKLRQSNGPTIEALLLQHGAREFSSLI
ncbi:Nn.00g070100.m01.CDS01 [Neocucurbitaria sp. VM-36]